MDTAQPGTDGPDRAPAPGVGQQASNALLWSLANAAISRFGTVAIGILLARLLGPTEFGTYAVAFVALMAALSFNDIGVSLAIVRWPGDPREIVPTVVTISCVASAILAITGVLIAGPFAQAMGTPEAAPVVRVLFLTVLVSGLVATPAALLQRDFRQKRRTLIDQVAIWLGVIGSLVFVLLDFGAMSLALGRIIGVTVSAAMFVHASPLSLRPGWDRELAGRLIRFGAPLGAASILVFFVGFADQLVIGHTLGERALGLYVVAFNIASWPLSLISQPLRNVAPAAFSRWQHEPATMRSGLNLTARALAAASLPAAFLLAAAAEPLVRWVYGDTWAGASDALLWLAILTGFKVFIELAYDYLVVVQKSNVLMAIQVLWLAALVPSLYLGTTWGVAGVAAAQVAVAAAVILPIYLLGLRRAGVSLRALVWGVLPSAAVSGVVAVGVWWLVAPVRPAWFASVLSMAVGGLCLAGLLFVNRKAILQLRNLGSEPDPVTASVEQAP